jgi:hypothetical protein
LHNEHGLDAGWPRDGLHDLRQPNLLPLARFLTRLELVPDIPKVFQAPAILLGVRLELDGLLSTLDRLKVLTAPAQAQTQDDDAR